MSKKLAVGMAVAYVAFVIGLAIASANAMDWTQPNLTSGACDARLAALSEEKQATINDFNDALTEAYQRIARLKNACGRKCQKL